MVFFSKGIIEDEENQLIETHIKLERNLKLQECVE
jgi:hypothetical protein